MNEENGPMEPTEPVKVMSNAQKFFDSIVSKIVFKLRYIILVLGLVVFVLNIVSINQIKIAEYKYSKILKDSHPIQKAFDWGQNELWHKDTVTFGLNWGVESQIFLNPNLT